MSLRLLVLLSSKICCVPINVGKKDITIDVGLQVLLSTNYARNIRDMLACIEKLPIDKQKEFENVVLLTFDMRLQPDDIHNIALKLAKNNGYEKKLQHYIDLTARAGGEVLMSSPMPAYTLQTFDTDFVRFDANKYEGLKVLRSKCSIKDVPELPHIVDLTDCSTVEIYKQNFQNVKVLKLASNSNVEITHSYNLPENIDFSQVQNICLNGCDLGNLDKLVLGKGQCAQLLLVTNLPPYLDASGYDKVELAGSDLSRLKHLKLKKAPPAYLENLIPPSCQVEILPEKKTVNLSLFQKIKQRFK